MYRYAGNSVAVGTFKTNTMNSFRNGLTGFMETGQSVAIKHNSLGAGFFAKG